MKKTREKRVFLSTHCGVMQHDDLNKFLFELMM